MSEQELYYGYCFTEVNGWHTPKVMLRNAEDAFKYCNLHHKLFPEIRIVDQDDFVVLRVVNHSLICPIPDGSTKQTLL